MIALFNRAMIDAESGHSMKKENLNQIFNGPMKILPILLQIGLALPVLGQPYYVAPAGSDGNPAPATRS